MKTLSVDFRERILRVYDAGEGTREEVAHRFGISLGMVKKLLQQRRQTGDLAPRHRFAGRKPKILDRHRRRFQQLLAKRPDLTLAELRAATGLTCTLPAIHYVLVSLDLTFKKNAARQRARQARHCLGAPTVAGGVRPSRRREPGISGRISGQNQHDSDAGARLAGGAGA